MLAKLQALYAKMDLVHWLLIVSIVCTVESKEILSFVGLVNPAWQAGVQKGMFAIVALAALVKQVKKTAQDAAKSAAGFIRIPALAVLIGLVLLLASIRPPAPRLEPLYGSIDVGCTPSQVTNGVQTAEATVPADAALGICIANVAEADAGKPIGQVVLDSTAKCLQNVIPIVTILDSQVATQAAAGQMSLADANASLAAIHAAAKLPAAQPLVLPAAPAKIGGHPAEPWPVLSPIVAP